MIFNTAIADLLLNAFPSGAYGLPALMRISEIVESTSVPSAAVECTGRPRLLINPEFVAQHASTPEKLVMLVMHELHHIILGHTRLNPRITPLDNIVFDAVINSMLCWLIPERAARSLFEDFYDHAKFPDCFLRPPPGWHQGKGGRTADALSSPELRHLADLHQQLYTEAGATYEELRAALGSHLSEHDEVSLLGDHRPAGEGSSSDGDLEIRAPELLEQVRRIVGRWPQGAKGGSVAATAAFLNAGRVQLPPPTRRQQLRSLLRRLAGRRGTAKHSRIIQRSIQIESPLPRVDRRTAVMCGLGQRPVLYCHTLEQTRRTVGGERVHVYLDVSGSMDAVIGPLYRAALDCEDCIHPAIHLFSTRVADVTVADLKRGVCHTTGGTSIECLAAHMGQHGVRRAVLVTDGYVGTPSASARGVLENCRLGVALFGPNTQRANLGDLVDYWLDVEGRGP